MLRIIFLSILAVLTAVNLVLLWQVYRKMKQNMDKKLEVIEPYLMARLTAFGINMAALAVLALAVILSRMF
jgi:hypothetical protein